MGINHILPIIIGVAMTVILGSQVAPSFVEKMKVEKIENKTLANQELIKDAIVRYIKMEGKIPNAKKDLLNPLKDLEDAGLIQEHHKKNFFNDDEYSFEIDKAKGILKISTTINDDVSGKYFSNSVKYKNAPTCVELVGDTCKNGLWETFYLLDETTHDIVKRIKED